ncbi:MAG: hypothetical protein K0U20_09300 [Proteobacteria bacterium]|nr:hypothetical protein [Pseudomonadota bacterium]
MCLACFKEEKITMTELYEVANKLDGLAYIAGGFYKDMLNGVQPKDIDVFCIAPENYQDTIDILIEYTGLEGEQKPVSYSIGIFEVIKPVVIKDRALFGQPEDMVETFDINITRVWIDSFYGLMFIDEEEEIEEQIKNKEFRATIFLDDEERTRERIERYKSYGYNCIRTEYSSAPMRGSSMVGGY